MALAITRTEHSAAALRREARRTKDSDQARRLLALALAYEWAYIFGAVCPEGATGVALIMPDANSEAMNLHLREIGREVTPGAQGVLVFDRAGWHTSRALKPPDNITLPCLPSYSPELNPVENVWEYLRKNKLALRVHDSYEEILQACCDAWTDPIAIPPRLASITIRDWAKAS